MQLDNELKARSAPSSPGGARLPLPSRADHVSLAHWDPRHSWTAFLGVAGVLLSVVFAVLDPGSSRGLSFVARMGFWSLHVMVPLAILQTVQMGLSWSRTAGRLHDWAQIAVSGIIGAVLFTPLAVILDRVFQVADPVRDVGDPLGVQLLSEFMALLPAMLLVWGGLNASRLLRLDAAPKELRPAADMPPDPAVEFWQRLPKPLGRDVVALTAELHYLRVHTKLGDALILYSFGRAVEELGARGHRVHRSHWVADRHVHAVERDGDRYTVRTDTGLSLPLSRTYRRELRDLCAERAASEAVKSLGI